jgi:hypothetical protein
VFTTQESMKNKATLKRFEKIYHKGGLSAVCDEANKLNLKYSPCVPCKCDTPEIKGVCAACGTTKKKPKKIKLTREEAEQKILDKECEDVKEQVSNGDLSYVNDIFFGGFKGYANFTDKELAKEIAEQFNVRDKTNLKFKIIKEKK